MAAALTLTEARPAGSRSQAHRDCCACPAKARKQLEVPALLLRSQPLLAAREDPKQARPLAGLLGPSNVPRSSTVVCCFGI